MMWQLQRRDGLGTSCCSCSINIGAWKGARVVCTMRSTATGVQRSRRVLTRRAVLLESTLGAGRTASASDTLRLDRCYASYVTASLCDC